MNTRDANLYLITDRQLLVKIYGVTPTDMQLMLRKYHQGVYPKCFYHFLLSNSPYWEVIFTIPIFDRFDPKNGTFGPYIMYFWSKVEKTEKLISRPQKHTCRVVTHGYLNFL